MEHQHESEWRMALKVAKLAPNTGMVPVKGCALLAAQAEMERLRATLRIVADIAHSGGLANHDDFSALTAIRRLTLDEWNPHGTTDEHRERVKEAGREAVRRSGA